MKLRRFVVELDYLKKRMRQRGVSSEDLLAVCERWDVIERRPKSGRFLLFGRVKNRTLHVAVEDWGDNITFEVVTVYEPDPKKWKQSLRKRKRG